MDAVLGAKLASAFATTTVSRNLQLKIFCASAFHTGTLEYLFDSNEMCV